jgi:hypothetical protein
MTDLLALLKPVGRSGDGWTARCPAHEDGHNSPRRNISEEDARQIVENVTGFFAILTGWSRAELSAPANDTGKPIASGNKEADHDR